MGAELILYNYNTSLQDAKIEWAMTYSSLSANIIEIENGFTTLGSFPIVCEQVFNTSEQAKTYIRQQHRKWQRAWAVRYGNWKNYYEKQQRLNQLEEFLRGVYLDFPYHYCRQCGQEHTLHDPCTVAHNSMDRHASPVRGRLITYPYNNTMVQEYNNIRTTLNEYLQKSDQGWIFGGWAAS